MHRVVFSSLFFFLFYFSGAAQKVVALDNWFNHEIKSKTGKIYHYTWDDKAQSGFSQLGEIFKSRGAELKTIQEKPDKKVFKDVDVYIIVDPDSTNENSNPHYIGTDDIRFLKKWVKKGGVLLLMANDGFNCEFIHLNMLATVFGFRFVPLTVNSVIKHQYEMGAETNFSNHSLFNEVKKIYMKEVAPLELSQDAIPVLKDEEGRVLMAEISYGKGYVLAIGDPWLYNEYIDHLKLPESFDNLKAANNLIDLLLEHTQK